MNQFISNTIYNKSVNYLNKYIKYIKFIFQILIQYLNTNNDNFWDFNIYLKI